MSVKKCKIYNKNYKILKSYGIVKLYKLIGRRLYLWKKINLEIICL